MRYLVAFGRFWYDFLIGDKPELFIGPAAGLVLAWLLVGWGLGSIAGIVLVAVVIVIAGWSLVRSTRVEPPRRPPRSVAP